MILVPWNARIIIQNQNINNVAVIMFVFLKEHMHTLKT